ncbi:E4 SUMO-protein ligase PIAL2 isoform X2 [Cynara cardunculus var. scolymus]|uniref:E4 SUMO-protein ligase PIAL2 isoform X2 n=1 Tax=Cynara cardunculus var. scolymus TaxID=59895 RepID=UPI000D625203|nr:E4 SUMO-protein ligase PIAL2 isoform X2 [Cynara cardunculus var. scolymus]
MTGTVMKPVGFAGTVDMSNQQTLSPSYVNSFRISAVTGRLLVHLRGDANTDNTEFFNLCLSLARGIDYAVANNEIPGSAPDLPYMLKQVCQRKNDLQLQAAIMVLMISVKSACSNGWFSEKEKEELHVLSDEMQSSFCSVSVKDMHSNMKNKGSNFHTTISTVMTRFYPGMKMGEILALVETTPGYDSYVTDLHISKSAKSSPDDKIYLFVAQTDNTETSSCIINPQQVNILLNGEGVDRRTCVYKDPGPQIPTLVTHMLKYGSNLLQVVGQFSERYIIVIAFMSVVSNPSCPTIPDYIPPAAALPDSDNEIVEGPSRISLKCPISFSRIKIPVKGHSCKHLQCFDFNNYVGMNSRRPLWRCPHCSQSVCFTDIRIDQSMVKVLKEVGEDVSYVKISSDGSWEAVTESNEHTIKPNDAQPLHQETTIQSVDDIMDLTEGDNEADTCDRDEDKKPSPAEFHGESSILNSTPVSMHINNVHGNIAPHMEDGFWREFYSSTLGTRTTNTRSDVNEVRSVRDAFASLDREIEDLQRNNLIFNSLTPGQTAASNSMGLQQYENSNNTGNGYVRYPTPANYVTRTAIAIQALPAQSSARILEGDRQQHQQQFVRSHLNQHQVSLMTSAPSPQHMGSQGHRDHSHLLSQTSPQLGGRSASPQRLSGGRHTSPLPTDRFNSHQQQSMNQRTPLPVRPSSQPSPQVRLIGAHGGGNPMTSPASNQPQYSLASIQRATNQFLSRTPPTPSPIQTSGSSVPVTSMGEQRGNSVDASGEQNWRPSGRMRGSLSGRAYTEALNQFIIHPNQPVQAARPPVLNTPRPFIPPHLQVLMANNLKASQTPGGSRGPDGSGGAG